MELEGRGEGRGGFRTVREVEFDSRENGMI